MRILYLFCLLIGITILFYAALPNPDFPDSPPGAKQSHEAADSETPFRRAYFTDLTREEVMNFYKQQFQKSSFMGLPLPTYRLNYPPEEAQTIIRDQARSTFLEEIVHPLRESLFINGFEPKVAKDAVVIEGIHYRQKITVKFVPSSQYLRILISGIGLLLLFYTFGEFIKSVRDLIKR